MRTLPQLEEVVREKIVGDMLSRSIMLSSMEEHVYLLVALGDGTVHYFQIDMKTGYSGIFLEGFAITTVAINPPIFLTIFALT